MRNDPIGILSQDGADYAKPTQDCQPPGLLAKLPIPVFGIAMAGLWMANVRTAYESPYLLMGLNLLFSALVALFVAWLIGRSFIARGLPGLLLLGCGVLFWGASGLTAVAATLAQTGSGFDFNLAVTIHNLCVWFSALCHLAGTAYSIRWGLSLRATGRWLAGGYLASLAAVGIVTWSALSGWTPDFFSQGQGGTLVRQFVLGSAVAMFFFTALMLKAMGRSRRSAFTEWYALALLLLAVGYLGTLGQAVAGSLLGWTGRAAQFLAGIYILTAAFASLREPEGLEAILSPVRQGVTRHVYKVAVALVVSAAIVRLVFLQALGTQVAFITFYPAVMLAALYGGIRPGLLAAVLSALFADYFWIEPVGHFAVGHPSGWLGIAVFLLSCTMISAITESMHRAHARARAAEAHAAFGDDPGQVEIALRTGEQRLAQEQLKAVFPVNAVFPAAMAMLALLFWFSYRNAESLLKSEQWEIQNHIVAMEFDRLLSALTAAESGERSYLISGDEPSLEPYRQASALVTGQLAALAQLTQANPQQQQRLREISGPVVERLGELDRTIAVRGEQGFEAARKLMGANFSPGRLDIIRQHVEGLMEDERRSRQQRMEAKTTNTRNAIQTGTLGVGLVFAMLGLVYFLLRKEIAERKLAEAEVIAHRGRLEVLVEARTAELEREFAEHRRAEEALHDNDERLRLTLEASSTGTFEVDFSTGEAQWNDVEYRLLGLKPGDITPSPEAFFRYLHPADLKHVQTRWEEAARSGHLDMEFRVLRADGEERWLAGRGRFAFADDAPEAQGRWFLGVNFDITEHKRAEERLRRSESSFTKAQAIANIGSWEWDVPTGEVRWSEQMYRIFGEEPQAFTPSFGGYMARVHPDDFQNLDALFNDAVAQGIPFRLEHRIVTCAGTVRVALAQVEIELGDQGRVARIAGTALDITERKQAEAAQARLAAIVEFSQDAIIGKNLDGIVTSWNQGAEQLFGYAAAEMLGKPFGCMIPENRLDEEMNILARIRRGDAVEHFETIRLRKDGMAIPIAITVSPVKDTAGQVIGVSKIARDISARKQAQDAQALQAAQLQAQAERLCEADRHKDEFLAMLAHELRNPLTPINIAAQMLEKRGGEDPALVRWASDTIKHQCEHLTQLVNQLLDVSRVSRGKITLNKSRTDLRELVKRAEATAKTLPGHDSHELILALPDAPIMLEADPVRLEQVLGNLLNNAFKYTPEGGRITLRLAQEDETAVIFVRDNGVGMSAAMLPRVFELFAQAERTLDRSQGGLGIGLALVKRLVELHGGSVAAFSAGPGQGSEFSVRLPLPAAPALEPAPAEVPPNPPASTGPTRRVLAVDDNGIVLASLAVLLKSLGHEVIVARDGQEALNIASQTPLDIALIDIGLPGLDGYTVARRLRQEFAPGRLTLVAMTGYNLEEDRQKSKNAGFDHHLAKPFDPAELEKILADLGNEHTKPDNLYRR